MDWKKLGKQLLFPPIWLMAVLTVLSAVGLTFVFIKGWETAIIAYGIYVLSFYTLSVVTVYCVMVLPHHWPRIREKFHKSDRSDKTAFRTSVCVNLLYILINLWSWYWNRSWWFVVLAAYYVIMTLLWSLLLQFVRKHADAVDTIRQWKRSRSCACILLLINLSLSGAVLMILYQSKGYDYPGILIYVMALYTFYSTIHAIQDIVKYRSLGSPVMTTAKIVSLSAALVSMLNLETAMFAQFGKDMAIEHQKLFIILTGAGVSIIVVTLSVLLIVKTTKEIRRANYGE